MSSRLVIPGEKEELALTVNGKRNRLHRDDFLGFAVHMSVAAAYAERRLADLQALHDPFMQMVDQSQLTANHRERLAGIIVERLDRLR